MAQLRGHATTKRSNLLYSTKTEILFSNTVNLYREVVVFFLVVIQNHQEILDNKDKWLDAIEKLTIKNKNNPLPPYNLHENFGKYPSGFRRAAIAEAYGQASSWRTRYRKWQDKKKQHEEKNQKRLTEGKKAIEFREHPPQYPKECSSWLSFYGTEYDWLDEKHISLKLFDGKTFVKRKIALAQPVKGKEKYSIGSPSLAKSFHGWEIQVPFVIPYKEIKLKKVEERVKEPDFFNVRC